jgi:ferredoxin
MNSTPAITGISLTIDGHSVEVAQGETVLHVARKLGIEIPTLCYLEKCGPLNSCLVCLVKINGKLVPSCGIPAQSGMVVESETSEVHEARRTALELLFSDHVGDCLSPCQRLCPLRMNIPVMIRQLQTQQVNEAVKTVRDALPLPGALGRLCHHPCEQGCRRATADEAAGIREMERFVADYDLGLHCDQPSTSTVNSAGEMPREPYLPRCKKSTGKSVVIVGAGPAGLTAAYTLLRHGHTCTIADRRTEAGGTLRDVNEQQLSREVLDAEIEQLRRLGAHFRLGAALGHDISLDGLLRGFDAVLVTVGELTKTNGEAWGLEMAPGGIKINPDTFQTNLAAVFAAGRAVKPVNQLVRAMTEGQWAAECIHLFLQNKQVQRPDKPFSSIMGRLEPGELETFVMTAKPGPTLTPCHVCSGFTKVEAAEEAARCLRCDCRSSGNCALQSYATTYDVDASRFRSQRRPFEQYVQPGGVIFEPGKCILCGICVKLTEMAREPLGLTFIGRGFDVRIATPFNQAIEAGLQKVAEECVHHCPTGALEFRDPR